MPLCAPEIASAVIVLPCTLLAVVEPTDMVIGTKLPEVVLGKTRE